MVLGDDDTQSSTPAEAAASQEPRRLTVGLSWAALDEAPVAFANVFSIGVVPRQDGSPGEVVISVGYTAPPAVSGTPEDQIRQLEAIGTIAIRPVARIGLSVERLAELSRAITAILAAIPSAATMEHPR